MTLQFVLFLLVLILFLANGRRLKQIIKAKDKEIEKLAADNRQYRQTYLTKVKGMGVQDYNEISAVPSKESDSKGGSPK